MNVACPECGLTGKIEDEKIPDGGRELKCPRCKLQFRVNREGPSSPVTIQSELAPESTKKVCNVCSSELDGNGKCGVCGNLTMPDEKNSHINKKIGTPTSDKKKQDVGSRHPVSDRVSIFMIKIIGVFVILGIVWVSIERWLNEKKADTRAKRIVIIESGSRRPDERKKIDELKEVINRIREEESKCVNQCERYAVAWYVNGEAVREQHGKRVLDSSMEDSLKEIVDAKSVIDIDIKRVGRLYKNRPYYLKFKLLYEEYDSIYTMATSPNVTYMGNYREIIGTKNANFQQTLTELENIPLS